MKNTEKTMDKIVALCKNRGFVFPGSEIYGGLANTWDYGPLGAELKKNIKNAWWKKFVQENPYNVGLDAAILMNPQTWVASGHLGGFSDPLMDCRECHERFRADKVIEDWCAETGFELPKPIDAFSQQEMKDFVEEHNIPCPTCGKHNFTDIRQFNLMFKTFQGVTEDAKNTVYLRPETAQGIFVNFNNVQRTTRKKLPFGIGQIGKSFRNEITPGNFIFRVREFEQMELEFFCKPGTDLEWFNYWRTFCHNWLLSIGLKDENLRLRDHDPEELCFYSKATTDFEFLFPFGWGELWGVADRTDYDLTQHQNTSGVKMVYREGEGKDMVEYVPYVIEPSLGVERSVLAVLCDAYDEEVVGQDKKGNDDVRVVLHFHPALAPFKAAILPLSKKDVLAGPAMELYNELSKEFMVDYDETAARTRSVRRTASRSTSTPSATRPTASRPTTASPSASATAWSRSVSPSIRSRTSCAKSARSDSLSFSTPYCRRGDLLMEFFDVIARRGSYRGEFEQSSIPQEELYRILDAGIRAPSGYNLQTATFYAVTDELLRRSLAEIFPTKAVQTAPVILVVTSQCIHSGDHNLQFETEDYAAATENIMLAITASGYAGVWMDGMMKFDGHTDAVRQLLHIPDSETPRTIIPFGKPAGPVSQRPKKAFHERVHIL